MLQLDSHDYAFTSLVIVDGLDSWSDSEGSGNDNVEVAKDVVSSDSEQSGSEVSESKDTVVDLKTYAALETGRNDHTENSETGMFASLHQTIAHQRLPAQSPIPKTSTLRLYLL